MRRSMTTINNRSHSDMFLICAVYLWVSTSRDVQVRWFQHESAVAIFWRASDVQVRWCQCGDAVWQRRNSRLNERLEKELDRCADYGWSGLVHPTHVLIRLQDFLDACLRRHMKTCNDRVK